MQGKNRRLHALSLALTAVLMLPSWRAHGGNTSPAAADATVLVPPVAPRLIDALALASDRDGDVLAISLDNTSCAGTVTDQLDGTFIYTPPNGVNETCTIGYRAFDGTATDIGTIQIVVSNDTGPPPMSGPPDGSGPVPGFDPNDTPRRFRRNGEALVLAGYYPGMHTLTDGVNVDPNNPGIATHYKNLLGNLASHDINLLRVFLSWTQAFDDRPWLHPYQRSTNTGCINATGGVCFDLDNFNQAFFDYWNAVITEAASHDIIIQVTILEARHTWGNTDWGWDSGYQIPPSGGSGNTYLGGRRYSYFTQPNNSNGVDSDNGGVDSGSPTGWYQNQSVVDAQKALVHHAVTTLGHHPNIIWEVANEPWRTNNTPPAVVSAWVDTMADEIRIAEAAAGHLGHLIIPADLPEHRDVGEHTIPGSNVTMTPADPNFTLLHQELLSDFGGPGSGPLIADNDCCFFAGTTDQRRKKAWISIVSGAYPSVFEFLADEVESSFFSPSTQQAVSWVGGVRRLINDRTIDLLPLIPRDDLLSVVNGGPVWALANEGSEYLVYFLAPGTVEITGVDSSVDAVWRNPRDGSTQVAMAIGGQFNTPSTNAGDDWVLHIREADAPPPAAQGPYPDPPATPHAIPGLIEAEHYDLGGEGQAYHDLTTTNTGTVPFRPEEGVDAQTLVFGSMPTVVTHIEAGEWVEYTVNVAPGRYAVAVRYASVLNGGTPASGTLRLQVVDAAGNPTELDRALTLPGSDGYSTVTDTGLDLSGGSKVLRLFFEQPAYHLNWLDFIRLDGPTADNETIDAESCSTSLLIDTAFLLDGDQPAGNISMVTFGQGARGSVVLDPQGPPLGDPASRLVYTPVTSPANDAFCSLGSDSFTYTIARDDDPAVTAQGTVTVVAPIAAEDDWFDAPDCDASFTFTVGDLLLNDVPAGSVEIIAIAFAGSQHGTLSAAGALDNPATVVTYDPAHPGFCSAGLDSVAYTIARIDDPTRTASGTLHIVAPEIPDPEAIDDTKVALSCVEQTSIQVPLLLANDTPRSHIYFLAFGQPDQGTGNLIRVLGIDKLFFTPTPLFCESGQTTFEYSIAIDGITECVTLPNRCSRAEVTIIAPAPPSAVDDGPLFTFRDRGLTIAYDQLLANDQVGTSFGGVAAAPGGGTLVDNGTALVYTPDAAGTTPNDTFTYYAQATTGRLSAPATVTIGIGGASPKAVDDTLLVPADTVVFIAYTTLLRNDLGASLTVAGSTAPNHGTVTAAADGLWFLPATSFEDVGIDTLTYTIVDDTHPEFPSTATVTLEAAAACQSIRSDDFESVPFGGWDGVNESGVTLATTAAAAIEGFYGLEVDVTMNGTFGFLEDTLPASENDYHVSFLFDPSQITILNGQGHLIFTADEAGLGNVLTLKLRSASGKYQITARAYDDAGTIANTGWIDLVAGPQRLDVQWWSASAPQANDGGLRFWLDRALTGVAFGLDNDQRVIDTVRLGAVAELNTNTEGIMRFDNVATCRGPMTRAYVRNDGFETGDLSDWSDAVGLVAETAPAALVGDRGLAMTMANQAHAYLLDRYAEPLDAVQMQLRFDPNSVKMVDGTSHLLLRAHHGPRVVLELKLRRMVTGFQLRMLGRRDDGSIKGGLPAWVDIDDQPQVLSFSWWRAQGAGADNGGASLAVDGQVRQTIAGLDNDELLFGELRLGAVANINATTNGTYYLDDVRVWRHPAARAFFHTDDFEGSTLEGWGPPFGSVSITSAAALNGGGGLEIVVPGTNAWIQDDLQTSTTSYHVQMGIDPSLLSIPSPNIHVLFQTRTSTNQAVTQVGIRAAAGGGHELRLVTWINSGGGLAAIGAPWVAFDLRPQTVTLEWSAAAPGSLVGGRAALLIDGVVVAALTGLDNAGLTIDRAFLGALGVDAGTAGSLYIDDFFSWRED